MEGSGVSSSVASSLKRRRPDVVSLVVVEDHNHALEHIHSAIRAKACPFLNGKMLHFDSHPDLACSPTIQAKTMYQPAELYEQLDVSPGGIAEWLLPLSFLGHLDCITWLKNSWSSQFPLGSIKLLVGEEKTSGLLKVTCESSELSYYCDDGTFVPFASSSSLLKIPKPLTLHVAELQASNEADMAAAVDSVVAGTEGWILDICLDYFACLNPFFEDLPTSVAQALKDVATKVAFRACKERKEPPERKQGEADETEPQIGSPPSSILTAECTHSKLLSKFLHSAPDFDALSPLETETLASLYDPPSFDLITALQKSLEEFTASSSSSLSSSFSSSPLGAPLVVTTCEELSKKCASLLSVAMLPHAPPPPHPSSPSPSSLSPPHLCGSIFSFLDCHFRRLEKEGKAVKRPGIITVARSADDGFTPRELVEQLQEEVIKGCEELAKRHFGCDVHVTRDYGGFIEGAGRVVRTGEEA